MTNLKHTPADSILVATDVSRQRNDVLIEIPGISRHHRLVGLNTRTEHDRFIDRLRDIGRPVIVGFEATGNYHRPLAYRLLQAGFELRLVSSVALARTREALHNGWDKNDPKDAQVILHMLKIGATQTYCDPICSGINDIQELSKTHEVISKAKTELWHRLLTHYLPLYFPEIARFAGNSRSDWFLAFRRASTPPEASSASRSRPPAPSAPSRRTHPFRRTWLSSCAASLRRCASFSEKNGRARDSYYREDGAHYPCRHQNRFRLSALLRRTDAKSGYFCVHSNKQQLFKVMWCVHERR
jgi:Transposase